jgi:hypothetical protein
MHTGIGTDLFDVGIRPMHTGIGTDTLDSSRGELHVEERE